MVIFCSLGGGGGVENIIRHCENDQGFSWLISDKCIKHYTHYNFFFQNLYALKMCMPHGN